MTHDTMNPPDVLKICMRGNDIKLSLRHKKQNHSKQIKNNTSLTTTALLINVRFVVKGCNTEVRSIFKELFLCLETLVWKYKCGV